MAGKGTFFSRIFPHSKDAKKANKVNAFVMGIINLTPDSFYDGGIHKSMDACISHVEKMLTEGVDIIDLGAVSTRPGAADIDAAEEERRLMPALEMLLHRFPDALFSVDTYRPLIAERAIAAGAAMINDVSGGTFDERMIPLIAEKDVPYVLMHMKGQPKNMQQHPHYDDVVKEVYDFFEQQTGRFAAHGFDKIILDPGFGFGKSLNHNYQLLNAMDCFLKLGYPLLAGMSRKSMLYKLLDNEASDALNATTVVNTIALIKGASVLRVHDVREAREAVLIVDKLNNNG